MGFLRVLSFIELAFKRNLPSVTFVNDDIRLTNMAFAPWGARLKKQHWDVMARQAEGLV